MDLDLAVLDRTAASLGLREAQRVATALAAARGVALAVCDEPVADPDGLDLALDLLARTRTYGATVVLAEGLRGLPEAVERIVVLHGGRVIEDLPRPAMADLALHPATHALLRDAGLLEPGSDGGGTHDSHAEVADACVYRALCPRAQPRCSTERPELARPLGAGHVVACHFPEAPAGPTGAATAPMAPQPPAPAWAAEPTGRDFAEG